MFTLVANDAAIAGGIVRFRSQNAEVGLLLQMKTAQPLQRCGSNERRITVRDQYMFVAGELLLSAHQRIAGATLLRLHNEIYPGVSGDAAYIKKLRDLELTDLPRELLVHLTAVSGDAAYIKELRDAGLIEDLPHELLVQLTAVGADVGYIRELRDAGLVELSHAQLDDLKARGVGAGSVQEVQGR